MWRRSLWLACVLTACATPKPASKAEDLSKAAASDHHGPSSAVWFSGPVEKAYETAKAQKKPIFLYWGAVWCPPCNQVKAEVFSTPEFADLMKLVVPVYLDGDSEGAQAWAEKLNVSGYPTLLMLGPDGKELLRISEALNIEEFSAAFLGAMSAGDSIQVVLQRALHGAASEADWKVLAYSRTDNLEHIGPATWIEVFNEAPERAIVERALIATKVLEGIAGGDKKDLSVVQGKMNALFDAIFFFDATVFAARSTIVYYSREVVTTLFPNGANEQRSKLIERWLQAAEWLETNPKAGISTRLHAMVPQYELWRVENSEKPLPAELVAKVKAAVVTADKDAKSSYERHAVISDGAEILADVGDVDGARAMLVNELKTTDTPWYYQATLAGIELKAGRQSEALEWSKKARESAKGDATQFQWLVLDLRTTMKVQLPQRDERAAGLFEAFFHEFSKRSWALSGRNEVQAHKVAAESGKVLDEVLAFPRSASVIQKWANVCREAQKAQLRCQMAGPGSSKAPPGIEQCFPFKGGLIIGDVRNVQPWNLCGIAFDERWLAGPPSN